MSESTTYTTPTTSAEPTLRWNYRSCDSTQCRWIHDLLPNERCWHCHKLPVRPSDAPDTVPSEGMWRKLRGESFDHLHGRLAEAERRAESAEQMRDTCLVNYRNLYHSKVIRPVDQRIAALTSQIETAQEAIRHIRKIAGREPLGEFESKIYFEAGRALAAIDAPPAERMPTGCKGIDWCETHQVDHGHPEPPCPDCSQDAGGVAKLCAKHGGPQPDGSNVAVAYGHIAAESPTPNHVCQSGPNFSECPECARQRRAGVEQTYDPMSADQARVTAGSGNSIFAATLRRYADLTERVDRVVANLSGPEPHSRWEVIRILQGNEGGGE